MLIYMHRLNTKIRLTMLLSGFELYSRWVPLLRCLTWMVKHVEGNMGRGIHIALFCHCYQLLFQSRTIKAATNFSGSE